MVKTERSGDTDDLEQPMRMAHNEAQRTKILVGKVCWNVKESSFGKDL